MRFVVLPEIYVVIRIVGPKEALLYKAVVQVDFLNNLGGIFHLILHILGVNGLYHPHIVKNRLIILHNLLIEHESLVKLVVHFVGQCADVF